MNELNYASLEPIQRLVKAGIVLETEKSWVKVNCAGAWHWSLFDTFDVNSQDENIPAPSMAEVWRELPNRSTICKRKEDCFCYIDLFGKSRNFYNTNPTDALIDLLIWVREQEEVKGNE